ncbi:MAG: 1-(5-phosphoribosyl)-5-[(5-phosphoribosylamino)methylideneamino]imidazole-4-carboxamide isomerase [Solirubrobacterales bacterium]
MRRPGSRVILYPAIDIRDGHAVRLVQGDYDRETVFDADPLEAALRWVRQGARVLHVVDLDGAREGRPANLEHVRRIAAEGGVPVQVGGGIRDAHAIDAVLEAGAARAIIGTKAYEDPELMARAVERHGDAIVASVDARQGKVAVSGWTEATEMTAVELIEAMVDRGVRRFVFTPVEVDGMLAGPGIEQAREAAKAVRGELIYSGGVGTLKDLQALAALGEPTLAGVIVGRALYDGRFEIADAHRVLGEQES